MGLKEGDLVEILGETQAGNYSVFDWKAYGYINYLFKVDTTKLQVKIVWSNTPEKRQTYAVCYHYQVIPLPNDFMEKHLVDLL